MCFFCNVHGRQCSINLSRSVCCLCGAASASPLRFGSKGIAQQQIESVEMAAKTTTLGYLALALLLATGGTYVSDVSIAVEQTWPGFTE